MTVDNFVTYLVGQEPRRGMKSEGDLNEKTLVLLVLGKVPGGWRS